MPSAPILRPLADLHEDPANVRRHPERNRAAVRASLAEFGQVETLVVQAGTGRVLGGNCRLAELRSLNVKEAWCIEVDIDGPAATRLALALNRTAELATWDEHLLDSLKGLDLGELWTADELAAMMPKPIADPKDQAAFDGTYAILVTCRDEEHQRELIETLYADGLDVRAWNL